MIKIIAGTYGYWNGRCVEPKTANDPPFELAPEKEQRLVNMGVAVYVVDAEVKQEVSEPIYEPIEEVVDTDEPITLESLAELKMEDLKEMAKEVGVAYKIGMKKQDFAKQIFDAMQYDDGEELPDADPADAIV